MSGRIGVVYGRVGVGHWLLNRCNDMHSTETIVVTLTLASGSLSPFSD